jgi:hypothetical protein
MKTSDLIDALAAETPAAPPRSFALSLTLWSLAGIAIAALLVVFWYGVRPDLSQALMATALKSSFGFLAALACAPLLLLLSRPNINTRSAGIAALVFAGASLLAAGVNLITAQSWAPLGLAGGFPECLKRVPLLALPIGAMLFVLVRSFAPTRLTLAGAAIGAFSGGISIIPYAMFCPMDSIAYVGVWYLLSVVVCAVIGAAVGGRALRWA